MKKKSQNSRNQGFSDKRIRIREAQKHMDTTYRYPDSDQDPQHCFLGLPDPLLFEHIRPRIRILLSVGKKNEKKGLISTVLWILNNLLLIVAKSLSLKTHVNVPTVAKKWDFFIFYWHLEVETQQRKE